MRMLTAVLVALALAAHPAHANSKTGKDEPTLEEMIQNVTEALTGQDLYCNRFAISWVEVWADLMRALAEAQAEVDNASR